MDSKELECLTCAVEAFGKLDEQRQQDAVILDEESSDEIDYPDDLSVISGVKLLDIYEKHHSVTSTGAAHLDDLLDGGIHSRKFYEFYGPDTGILTDLSLNFLFRVLRDSDKEGVVLYIQAGKVFDTNPLLRVIQRISSGDAKLKEKAYLDSLLLRFRIITVFDWKELIKLLDNIAKLESLHPEDRVFTTSPLEAFSCLEGVNDDFKSGGEDSRRLKRGKGKESKEPSVDPPEGTILKGIVVDALPLILGTLSGAELSNVCEQTSNLLRKIALWCYAKVMVINYSSSFPQEFSYLPFDGYPLKIKLGKALPDVMIPPPNSYRSALGRYWIEAPHVQVQIERISDLRKFKAPLEEYRLVPHGILLALLTKSPSQPTSRYCHLLLSDGEISDVP